MDVKLELKLDSMLQEGFINLSILFNHLFFVCCCSCMCVLDVGGYFETGTLVRYDFPPDAGAIALREESLSNVGVPSEANLTQEELVFSFSTSSAPSILVYISSRTQDYLAVVLRHNGRLINIIPDQLPVTRNHCI